MQKTRIKLWDLPTRLVHWLLFFAVAGAFATGLIGGNWMVWHGRLGLVILGLVVFRLVWGVVGSTYARFSQFVRGPGVMFAYLRGRWQGLGHNPLGAVSVLVLLGLLLFQALTGLVTNDDIAFKGPLYSLVTTKLSAWLTGLHRQAMWPLGILVTLHIGAMLFYKFVRRDDLIQPMLTGYKDVADPAAQSARGGGILALLLAVGIAVLVVWIADGGLLAPPPPPPPAGTIPTW